MQVGLEIYDVNMGDQGFYSCALKNPYGEDSTAGHVGVRKLYQAPVFTQRFKHQQQVSLMCASLDIFEKFSSQLSLFVNFHQI